MGHFRTAVDIVKTYRNPYVVFANRLRIPTKQHCRTLTLRNGLRFKTRSNTQDTSFANEIWVHRTYAPPGFRINENDTVVDIGAHIGLFSVFAATQARTGMVYAFEPLPGNIALLKENLKLNAISNAIPIQMAVGSRSEQRTFYVSSSNTGASSFIPYEDRIEEILARTISLTDLVRLFDLRTIDFLKMDCEGAEYEILFNAPHDVTGKIKRIAMEIHNVDSERNVRTFKAFLEREGFIVTLKMPNLNDTVGILYALRPTAA
jgi:FkbM family methyltransferase